MATREMTARKACPHARTDYDRDPEPFAIERPGNDSGAFITQIGDEDRLSPSDALRLRLASSKDPNADLRTNQEIAAVYLGRDRDVGSPPPEEGAAETEIPGDVIEAIQAVILGTPQP